MFSKAKRICITLFIISTMAMLFSGCSSKITKDNMTPDCAYNTSTGKGIKLHMTKAEIDKILDEPVDSDVNGYYYGEGPDSILIAYVDGLSNIIFISKGHWITKGMIGTENEIKQEDIISKLGKVTTISKSSNNVYCFYDNNNKLVTDPTSNPYTYFITYDMSGNNDTVGSIMIASKEDSDNQ